MHLETRFILRFACCQMLLIETRSKERITGLVSQHTKQRRATYWSTWIVPGKLEKEIIRSLTFIILIKQKYSSFKQSNITSEFKIGCVTYKSCIAWILYWVPTHVQHVWAMDSCLTCAGCGCGVSISDPMLKGSKGGQDVDLDSKWACLFWPIAC